MKQELKEIRNHLFSAPVEIKEAYNALVNYFDGMDWKEFIETNNEKLFVSEDPNNQRSNADLKRYNHRQGILRQIKSNFNSIVDLGAESNSSKRIKSKEARGYRIIQIPETAWTSKEDLIKFLHLNGVN